MSDTDDQKNILKEALKEWLDEKWEKGMATFGKWVARALAAAIFGALVYLVLIASGWHR